MTQRERQILNWIEADPTISQQELADRAGITRSSVAVHISNLMKKGCIAGKGYIVTRSPYVTVVGGMNMDIGGRPNQKLVGKDSNPGTVRMRPGGVGRNIAHNMSLMGLDVRLVTAFGDDVYAQKLAAVCGELGIDISQSPVIPGGHTSTGGWIPCPKQIRWWCWIPTSPPRAFSGWRRIAGPPSSQTRSPPPRPKSSALFWVSSIPSSRIVWRRSSSPGCLSPTMTASAGRRTPCWRRGCTGYSSPWGPTASLPPTTAAKSGSSRR